jgi:hypothetical protein
VAWRARRGIVLQTSDDVADLTVPECVRHFSRFYPAPAGGLASTSFLNLALAIAGERENVRTVP